MGLIYEGVRIAQRSANTPQPQGKPKEWQPFTKLVWLVFIFGIPIAMGGAARFIALVILGAIVALVLCVLVWAIGKSTARRGEEKDPVAAYLDEQEARR